MTAALTSRVARVASQMPAPEARRWIASVLPVIGGQAITFAHLPMQAGARVAKTRRLAAAHWRKREPVINAMHAAIVTELTKVKREVLRNIKSNPPVQAGEGEGHPFHGNQWTDAHASRLSELVKKGDARSEEDQGEMMSLQDRAYAAEKAGRIEKQKELEKLAVGYKPNGNGGFARQALQPDGTYRQGTVNWSPQKQQWRASVGGTFKTSLGGSSRFGESFHPSATNALEHSERYINTGSVSAKDSPMQAGVGASLGFDLEKFKRGLLDAIGIEIHGALETAADQLMDEIGHDPWQMPTKETFDFIHDRENLLSDTADSIHADVMTTIEQGLAEGESMKKLMARISDEMDGISEGRAKNIASTETGAAYGYARQEAMKEAGVETKTWIASHIRTRDWHEAAAEDERNQNIPVDQPFIVENADGDEEELQYPGDPAGSPSNVCGCHCFAAPGGREYTEEDDIV